MLLILNGRSRLPESFLELRETSRLTGSTSYRNPNHVPFLFLFIFFFFHTISISNSCQETCASQLSLLSRRNKSLKNGDATFSALYFLSGAFPPDALLSGLFLMHALPTDHQDDLLFLWSWGLLIFPNVL